MTKQLACSVFCFLFCSLGVLHAHGQVFERHEDRRAVLCGTVGKMYESATAENNNGASKEDVERFLIRYMDKQFPEIDEMFIENVVDSIFDDPWFFQRNRPFISREMSDMCMSKKIPYLFFSEDSDLLTGQQKDMDNKRRCFYISGMIGMVERWKINRVPLYRAQKRMLYSVIYSGSKNIDPDKWWKVVENIYNGTTDAGKLSQDLYKDCKSL